MKNLVLRHVIRMSKLFTYAFLFQCLTMGFLVASNGNAQIKSIEEVVVRLPLEGVPVKDAFKKIEGVSDFTFVYLTREVRNLPPIFVEDKDQSLYEVLVEIARQSGLDFKQINHNIHVQVSRKGQKKSIVTVSNVAVEIRGTVADENGNPIPGATVLVEGTSTGTATDIDGKFSLDAEQGAVLLISFIGYQPQRVTVGNQSSLSITLVEDQSSLEEVVVVGYGTQEKVNLIGSIAEIKGKEITNLPVPNVSNSLGGRLPGVVAIQRGGEPGNDAASINIRGFGNALVIVDGVVQQLDLIDPNDIESISVLKDASAAVFGARAANGVILVTTKRGSDGPAAINFSSNFGWQTSTKWPRMADSGEFTQLINQGRINQGQPLKYTEYDVKVYKYVSGDKDILSEMTNDELARFNNEDLRNYLNEDPNEAAFKKFAPMQQYNLSSSGGSKKVKYFLSGGFLNQRSMLRSDDTKYQRFNLRSNIDAEITDNLSIGMNFSAQYQIKEYPLDGIASIMQLTYWGEPVKYKSYPDQTKPVGSIIDRSNADLTGHRNNDYKEYNAALNFNLKIPFVKGLNLSGQANYRTGFFQNERFSKQYFTYNYDFKTDLYTRNPNPTGVTSLYIQSRQDEFLTQQFSLNYNNSFGRHDLGMLLLYEGLYDRRRYLEGYREGFLSTALQLLDAGGRVNINNGGNITESGRASYVGRINYSYFEKYLIEAAFRYDGNSMWAGDNQWGLFPAVMLGYRLSEEKFLKNSSFVDNLKIRGSVGISGDDNGGIPYQFLATYRINGNYVIDNGLQNGIINDGLANPNGTWAEYRTSNVGLDFGLLGGRVYGEFEAFYRYGYKLLGRRSDALPSTFGASFPMENLNSSSNRGLESLLGYRNKIGEIDFDISGNISWNRAKWEEFEERDFTDVAPDIIARDRISGRWINTIWGYTADGLFQSQEEINNWPVNQDGSNNSTLRPGDIKYFDLNGDGILNRFDESPIGNNTPLTMFGLNFNLAWRNIDMSLLAQGAASFLMYANEERAPAMYEGNTYAYIAKDTWTEENPDASFPRFVAGNTLNNRQISTFFIRDASYIRIKNLQVGYSFPESLLDRWNITRCRFYFSGVNLATLSRMKAFDPEAPIGDMRYYPQQKTYSVGFNITL